MTVCNFFEVTNGDYKGTYISISKELPWEQQRQIMSEFQCGAIGEYAFSFYKRHGYIKDGKQNAWAWRLNSYGMLSVRPEKIVKIQNKLKGMGCIFSQQYVTQIAN
ncbi:hypothetical protein PP175_25480 (plasmid) [Aneurinibacillus sp. Ricciae_BoGa-3]|uniref:hypothetical protein n=1 Tax=Aneurinibacillus sp. Ricciae_BoGa-3 TaxID=3022697 RepID=UPI00234021A8|nr:hypothetical protein [Aneurinibacillus sp. Ricciae_BoGa-3]WCK57422.1 hypothetical protein PP175_25480 [Aneurinibacillus sp. Ricciae_BoGa-3]